MGEGVTGRSFKERQYQEREEFILQVAEEILLAKGYYEMSMDDIAVQVGIARGTLYRHFASKDDLVFALFKRDLPAFLRSLEEILAASSTAKEKLETALCVTYQRVLGKHMSLLYVLSENGVIPSFLQEKKADMKEVCEAVVEHIRRLLEAGKASGEFDTTLPTDVLSYTFFSLVSPMIYKRLVVEGNKTEEELAMYLARIYLKIVAAPS